MMEPEDEKCGRCGQVLNDEEIDYPNDDPDCLADGRLLCDECYRELYQYDCCLCGESDENEFQHRMIVIYGPTKNYYYEDMIPGIYRINRFPYHSSDMLSHCLIHTNLTFLCGLTDSMKENFEEWSYGYPAGHLCESCQIRYGGFEGYQVWRDQALAEMATK